MGEAPLTRPSLLVRLRDGSDHEAWGEFVSLYGPLIYQFGRRRGLQDADAADVTQAVFQAVSREIQRLEYDRARGSFRAWLLVVARNLLCKQLEQARRLGRAIDNGAAAAILENRAAEDREVEAWDREYRLRVFQLAADRIRHEFEDTSWMAFWQTAVEGRAAKEVGHSLSMSVGAVYTARSRILARLKTAVKEYDELDESATCELESQFR